MEESRQEVRETVVQGDGIVSRQQVVATQAPRGYKLEQVIWLILGILLAMLGLRVLLALLAANQANSFAHLIFSATYPFVVPFFGLFGYRFQYGVSHLEVETLVAMAVYSLVAWAIVKLVHIFRH
jgi:hypothetical protein